MKTTIITVFLSITATFLACTNREKPMVKSEKQDTIAIAKVVDSTTSNVSDNVEPGEVSFPLSGKNAKSFVPKNYAIDLEAEGDLNHDGRKDKVLVLIKKTDTIDKRASLILLRQIDNSYVLDKKSFSAVEPKYRSDVYQIYDTENVGIDKFGVLTFQMYGTGPSGNLFSSYKYINNELVLVNINSFSMGAGGQTELDLDVLKGIYKETNTNTMKEDMPSETITKKYKIDKVLFENSHLGDLVIKAFDVNGVK
ncbi:hypothetical protein ACFOG5_15755 [Pedobacter fastidiosus]|uniref:Lipoprotein n=1 Tax=Pedobacter fastidiosus TaxID=2765361 RepID=A0ABR7KQ57_9SPHI|nr:hypothetical protein [Pedobacter fastidiosus]MBC6110223.1 hypothetical protein [Pedobacter fastidiosus]